MHASLTHNFTHSHTHTPHTHIHTHSVDTQPHQLLLFCKAEAMRHSALFTIHNADGRWRLVQQTTSQAVHGHSTFSRKKVFFSNFSKNNNKGEGFFFTFPSEKRD
jgi:hypothetical protein